MFFFAGLYGNSNMDMLRVDVIIDDITDVKTDKGETKEVPSYFNKKKSKK